MINGISLFANVGIGETYFYDNGINICISNELIEKRAEFYSHLYPDAQMICGDITDPKIFNQLIGFVILLVGILFFSSIHFFC